MTGPVLITLVQIDHFLIPWSLNPMPSGKRVGNFYLQQNMAYLQQNMAFMELIL
jgi:hypothetical protein